MQTREHWDTIYRDKAANSVSWYQTNSGQSLRLLDELNIANSASLIDVGGGASNLVDALLERGWKDLTVLDIAESALRVVRERLAERAATVEWQVADITGWKPERTYDVWHDRAVFHFLTEAKDREAYLDVLRQAVISNGYVIIATFGIDGPEKCSGLPVRRYDHKKLAAELGDDFSLLAHYRQGHTTPGGNTQSFTWCAFARS